MGADNVSIIKVGQTRAEKECLLAADGLPKSTIKMILDRGEVYAEHGGGNMVVANQPEAIVVLRPGK